MVRYRWELVDTDNGAVVLSGFEFTEQMCELAALACGRNVHSSLESGKLELWICSWEPPEALISA